MTATQVRSGVVIRSTGPGGRLFVARFQVFPLRVASITESLSIGLGDEEAAEAGEEDGQGHEGPLGARLHVCVS